MHHVGECVECVVLFIGHGESWRGANEKWPCVCVCFRRRPRGGREAGKAAPLLLLAGAAAASAVSSSSSPQLLAGLAWLAFFFFFMLMLALAFRSSFSFALVCAPIFATNKMQKGGTQAHTHRNAALCTCIRCRRGCPATAAPKRAVPSEPHVLCVATGALTNQPAPSPGRRRPRQLHTTHMTNFSSPRKAESPLCHSSSPS